MHQRVVGDCMEIGMVEHDVPPRNDGVEIQVNTHANPGAEEPTQPSKCCSVIENVVTKGAEPMDLAGRERLTEPLFLKKMLLEESGDTFGLTTVIMTVHAVMLESGFMLFNPDSGMSFSFMDEILSISLKYTLPALISVNEPNGIEFVSLKFQSLGHMVVVYGSLGVGSLVRRVCFDIRRYFYIVDLLMGTLESEKEDTLSIHNKVFKCWRMIKDGLVTPLLIDLHYKSGLELPPCFICLPLELKRKIVESVSGLNIARLACVSSELRDLASDNDLWKQKCMEEYKHRVTEGNDVVDWKEKYATFSKYEIKFPERHSKMCQAFLQSRMARQLKD